MALWFWIGVAFVSWGLASFFGKMVAPYFAPTYLLWIRSIITIVLLLPIVWAQRANSISITPTWQTWVLVMLVTSFTASAVIGFYNALRLGRRLSGHARERHLPRADGDTGSALPWRTHVGHAGAGHLLCCGGYYLPDPLGAFEIG